LIDYFAVVTGQQRIHGAASTDFRAALALRPKRSDIERFRRLGAWREETPLVDLWRRRMEAPDAVAVVAQEAGSDPGTTNQTTQAQAALPAGPLLADVAEQIALPAHTWTASGTHTAKGYTTEAGETTSIQIDKLCDPATTYPIVHDEQHDTYWIDEPFTCTRRTGPS
jgi:hypothetical protein